MRTYLARKMTQNIRKPRLRKRKTGKSSPALQNAGKRSGFSRSEYPTNNIKATVATLAPATILTVKSLNPFNVTLSVTLVKKGLFLFSGQTVITTLAYLIQDTVNLLLCSLLALFGFICTLEICGIGIITAIIIVAGIVLIAGIIETLLGLLVSTPNILRNLSKESAAEEL